MKRYYADMFDMRDNGGLADGEFVLFSDVKALEGQLALVSESYREAHAALIAERQKSARLEAARDALQDIMEYGGGAETALEDEYVMDRASRALSDCEEA